MSQLLRRDVDLVDLARADTVTVAQVVVNGERLYKDDSSVADFFETTALSAYALLNEERADIISNIIQSGTVDDR